LKRTRDIVPTEIPVTVKMRRGIDDTTRSRDNFFQILDGAIATGISAVTIHGRTVVQRYVGASNWEFLAEVKTHVGTAIKILGSGDLFSAEDCLRMLARTGIDGVTVARGAIGNPWIFSQCRALAAGLSLPAPPSLHQQADVMRTHYDLCERTYSPERAPFLMRKFCIKYSQSHPSHDAIKLEMTRMRSRLEFEQVLQHHYQVDGPGRYVPRDLHRSQEESSDCESDQ
jgi:tRNA-dihydrouridine synthase